MLFETRKEAGANWTPRDLILNFAKENAKYYAVEYGRFGEIFLLAKEEDFRMKYDHYVIRTANGVDMVTVYMAFEI